MPKRRTELIVALDVPTLQEAENFVDLLLPQVNLFKVGFQLFTACGTDAIKMIGKKNAQVFLDLKFLDIPKTVCSAVVSGTSSSVAIHSIPTGFNEAKIEYQVKEAVRYPVFMMTLHTISGEKALEAAAKGASDKAAELKIKKPYVIGVTVLTSEPVNEATVLERAMLAKKTGLDGVVCSAKEAALVKEKCGKDFIVVTPAIRLEGSKVDDQARTATPKEAMQAGADYIVVGRPIIEAEGSESSSQADHRRNSNMMFTHAVLFKIDKKEVKKYYRDCRMWARFAGRAKGFLSYRTMKRTDHKNQYASVYAWKTKRDHDRFMSKFHDWLVEKSQAKVKTLGYYNLEGA